MQKKGESQRLRSLPPLGPGPVDVVGFGENSVDIVAAVPRWPYPDEKLELLDFAVLPGGQVASALVACARLGCRTHYLGVFGTDSNGRLIEEALSREGVSTRDCVRAAVSNRVAVVLVTAADSSRTVLWQRDPALAWPVTAAAPPVVSQTKLLLVDATDARGSQAVATQARSAGVPVVLDIDQDGAGVAALLPFVDVLIAAEGFPKAHTGERTMSQAMRALHTGYGPAAVVVTLGSDGAICWDGTREILSPGFAATIVDSTGAGDAFRGGFLAEWINTGAGAVNLAHLLDFANATAAINCEAKGAQRGLPTRDQVLKRLTKYPRTRSNQTSPGNGIAPK